MKIVIGSDHGGYKYKNIIIDYLKSLKYDVYDVGTFNEESCDYPDIAKTLVNKIINNDDIKGILICGTGIGMSIAANKYNGIRAALCSDTFSARASRAHNNSNILCMGERVIGIGLAKDIVKIWLETDFEAGRHLRRINKLENNN